MEVISGGQTKVLVCAVRFGIRPNFFLWELDVATVRRYAQRGCCVRLACCVVLLH